MPAGREKRLVVLLRWSGLGPGLWLCLLGIVSVCVDASEIPGMSAAVILGPFTIGSLVPLAVLLSNWRHFCRAGRSAVDAMVGTAAGFLLALDSFLVYALTWWAAPAAALCATTLITRAIARRQAPSA